MDRISRKLTLEDKAAIVYWVVKKGYPQQHIAEMFEVNNGRVSEVVTDFMERHG